MNILLKDVFWLKGTNEKGKVKFFPVVFTKNLESMFILGKENRCVLLAFFNKNKIRNYIESSIKTGVCKFTIPCGLKLGLDTKLYYAPELYKEALKNNCFNSLPLETNLFTTNYNGALYSDKLEEFCNNVKLPKQKIRSYSKTFKKATKFIETKISQTEKESVL